MQHNLQHNLSGIPGYRIVRIRPLTDNPGKAIAELEPDLAHELWRELRLEEMIGSVPGAQTSNPPRP
jgi:hypothetical protein